MGSVAMCGWLTEQLTCLPLVSFPFNVVELPLNGIYFFYETGEVSAHGNQLPRIVRVGTHKKDNFRKRIAEHYLLNDRRMLFDRYRAAPHERSIFRKNIGRVLLNRSQDPYLAVWEIDFTETANLRSHGHLRDVEKELQVEHEITRILRKTFSFRFVAIEDERERLGAEGLECHLIGTVAQCTLCGPSASWLGNESPIAKIRDSGLWQVQHLANSPLSDMTRALFAGKL